jgi:hypothetical protein
MEKIAIQLEKVNGIARINEPVGLGIPLPKGTVQTVHNLTLMDDQKPLSLQLEPLAHWPDGSIRWVHASFLVSLELNSKKGLMLAQQPAHSPCTPEPVTNQSTESLVIHTSTGRIALQPGNLAWQVFNHNDASVPSMVSLSDEANAPCTVKAESNWEISQKGPVFIAATLKGEWLKQNNDSLARFQCELRVFLETGLIQVELVTHNPKRARHPGGLWDLGDPGSVFFRELAVETTLPAKSNTKVTPQATDESPSVFHLSDFNLYQDSSGGENWRSRNHIDSNGEISTQFCGYRLTSPSGLQQEGKRANPLVSIEHDGGQLDVAVPGFWQNFPTSLRKEGNKLTVGLLPKDAKNAYELQGGERKALSCSMAHQSNNNISATEYAPLVPVLTPECYEQAGAFPWFKANTQPGALDELIAEGLNGNSNFFAKREVIDEFGWRNFGEIFADHETLYQAEGEPPFVSHYNNQYDPIYGFARQFTLTGDKRWYQLMDDLARHVVDIDIYHTEEDRAEYNNGLFWHTDHYLPTQTATHRTFSRHNDTRSTPGQTGGGPAAEHCYTTGLLYHYLMTGDLASRQAVLDLANWMIYFDEGAGGLLEQLLSIKKNELPKLKALLSNEHPSRHRYPFTRGTGNYINALMDASILESPGDWLRKAERVIEATFHPADKMEERNLLDVETGWHYLVLLTSLSRYLLIKAEAGAYDYQYQYGLACFRHYTRWMLEHERPFLTHPGQLEFPNHTWTAQDMRKTMLMHQAAVFDPSHQSRYLKKACEWFDYVSNTLAQSTEKDFSRIQVILLQNYGPHQISIKLSDNALDTRKINHLGNRAPLLSAATLAYRIGNRLIWGILTFRLRRERAWLTARLER